MYRYVRIYPNTEKLSDAYVKRWAKKVTLFGGRGAWLVFLLLLNLRVVIKKIPVIFIDTKFSDKNTTFSLSLATFLGDLGKVFSSIITTFFFGLSFLMLCC